MLLKWNSEEVVYAPGFGNSYRMKIAECIGFCTWVRQPEVNACHRGVLLDPVEVMLPTLPHCLKLPLHLVFISSMKLAAF